MSYKGYGEETKQAPRSGYKSTGAVDLNELNKEELIRLVTNYGKHELRETNYKISLVNERLAHFEKAISELEESVESKRDKAEKYRQMSRDPSRLTNALERVIENNKKKIEELQVEIEGFEKRKAMKAVEQNNAKREITKNLVKNVYKYLEKHSDPVIVKLMETFTALLRNKPTATREDVELYFRTHKGLQTALNKVNPRLVTGENAKAYSDNIHGIRHHFTDDNQYHKYIPFIVYLNQTCAIVSLTVEEKQLEHEVQMLEDDIKSKEKEIDEVDTFKDHVDDNDVIDYDEQANGEEEQLRLLSNHYALLKLRLKKLVKYSKFFDKYYFDAIIDSDKLDSNKPESIDTMDDVNNVRVKERTIGSIPKSVSRKTKGMLASSPGKPKGNRDHFRHDEELKGKIQLATFSFCNCDLVFLYHQTISL